MGLSLSATQPRTIFSTKSNTVTRNVKMIITVKQLTFIRILSRLKIMQMVQLVSYQSREQATRRSAQKNRSGSSRQITTIWPSMAIISNRKKYIAHSANYRNSPILCANNTPTAKLLTRDVLYLVCIIANTEMPK